ncbi:outer membrane beta-barrel protein [Paracoccus sp. PAR01]|uniref:outer membrane beta-barrel protein n=1 Tax=Paracoccus sp. PAR01 TaxID=2769282 RepID=UPI00177C4C71|nr:outer membrane beta-barrel protein [Paracoccus sp. PAR01]MBD9529573.1 outer membrane beta-barrel protein [Paracoccus sp. PAR01]
MMRNILLAGSAAALAAAAPATAQDRSWHYSATSYLWFPETKTRIQTPRGAAESELSVQDALENLDMGLMLTAQAQRDRWSVVGDLLYLDVDGSAPSPFGLLFSEVAAESKLTAISGYGFYQVWADPRHRLDLGAGLRAAKADVTLTFRAGVLPQERLRIKDDWIDPVLALRYSGQVAQGWSASVAADYGGFHIGDASEETWQVIATLGYQLNEKWSLQGGYRYLRIDQEKDGLPYRLEMSGPVIGVSMKF